MKVLLCYVKSSLTLVVWRKNNNCSFPFDRWDATVCTRSWWNARNTLRKTRLQCPTEVNSPLWNLPPLLNGLNSLLRWRHHYDTQGECIVVTFAFNSRENRGNVRKFNKDCIIILRFLSSLPTFLRL